FEFNDKRQADSLEWHRDHPAWVGDYESTRDSVMRDRSLTDWYLTSYGQLRQAIAESKLLTERIRLVRDLVANKALVFDVLEAAEASDWDTPAGIARLLTALKAAPVGETYGASDVHFAVLAQVRHAKSDTSAIGSYFIATYPAEQATESFELAKYFDG